MQEEWLRLNSVGASVLWNGKHAHKGEQFLSNKKRNWKSACFCLLVCVRLFLEQRLNSINIHKKKILLAKDPRGAAGIIKREPAGHFLCETRNDGSHEFWRGGSAVQGIHARTGACVCACVCVMKRH